jgi:hypothetical protein
MEIVDSNRRVTLFYLKQIACRHGQLPLIAWYVYSESNVLINGY